LVVISRRAASWKMMRVIMTCDEISFEAGATSAQGYKKILLFDSLDRTRRECNWSLIERLFALFDAHPDAISHTIVDKLKVCNWPHDARARARISRCIRTSSQSRFRKS
jgi:hypothetical protein